MLQMHLHRRTASASDGTMRLETLQAEAETGEPLCEWPIVFFLSFIFVFIFFRFFFFCCFVSRLKTTL